MLRTSAVISIPFDPQGIEVFEQVRYWELS